MRAMQHGPNPHPHPPPRPGPASGLCSFTPRLSSKPSRAYSTFTGTSPKYARMSTHRRNIDRRTEGDRALEKCPWDRHFPETIFPKAATSRTHTFLAFPLPSYSLGLPLNECPAPKSQCQAPLGEGTQSETWLSCNFIFLIGTCGSITGIWLLAPADNEFFRTF